MRSYALTDSALPYAVGAAFSVDSNGVWHVIGRDRANKNKLERLITVPKSNVVVSFGGASVSLVVETLAHAKKPVSRSKSAFTQ